MQRYNKFLCRPKTEKINYKFPKQRFGFFFFFFARMKSSFIFLKARLMLVFLYFGGFSFYFGFRLLAFGFVRRPLIVVCCLFVKIKRAFANAKAGRTLVFLYLIYIMYKERKLKLDFRNFFSRKNFVKQRFTYSITLLNILLLFRN